MAYAFAKTLGNTALRPTALRCIFSIFRNFFFDQFCAALFSGRIPISRVDHPLDLKIPFRPGWVNVYLDFVSFWIRTLTFMLKNYGFRAFGAAREMLTSIGKLYAFAAQIYRKNLSTTDRPFYVSRPRFFMIHLLDPHLMCIPSLHVMVVAYAHAKFAALLRALGVEEKHAAQIEEMRHGAISICHAILFVKQHSVNCIGASIYALTRFDPALFPPEKAEDFCSWLFVEPPSSLIAWLKCVRAEGPSLSCSVLACKTCGFAVPGIRMPAEDVAEIKTHITDSYRRFHEEGKTAKKWEDPLLNFLRGLPQK